MQAEQREVRVPHRRPFLAVTLLSPIVLLLALELALRVVGFGGSYPLFVAAEDLPGHLRANPRVIQRYFAGAPDLEIDRIYFKEQKPPNSQRIVVQGGSTAAGFPYGRWGGLAGMLGDRLEATFPDREIEVITTAMAAVNSYTLLDFVDEIIEIEPDAVLIYAGHNEYLGIMGVASALSSSRFRSLTLLRLELRKLRLYQLLEWLTSSARSLVAPADENASADRVTLMTRAAASARIPYASESYRQGARQLEANLGRMLKRYQEAGVAVYLGTLASNEAGLEPFASEVSNRVDQERWRRIWQAYQKARQAGDGAAARNALLELLELDGDVADVWYALGRLDHEGGRIDAAREAYRNARDRDELRFRAPSSFNRVLRGLAERHGATLVDVEQHLVDASPQGIIGDELFLEHVHPNAEGYFLLADAYYEALKKDGRIGDWSGAPSRERARRDMPITAIDRILADHAVRELKADFPFREIRQEIRFPTPRNEIERVAELRHLDELTWIDGMDQLLQIHRRAERVDRAVVVARVTAQAYPDRSAPNYATGALFMQLQEFARARRYLERSLLAAPDDTATLRALVRVYRALGNEPRAKTHLARLKQIRDLASAPVPAQTHDPLLDSRVERSIAGGIRFLNSQGERINAAVALLCHNLRIRFGSERLPLFPPIVPERVARPRESTVQVFWRLVDPAATISPAEIDAFYHPIDRMTARALHCDRQPLPDDFDVTLREATRKGGYDLTHAVLAARWVEENGCRTQAQLAPLFLEQASALVALVGAPRVTTDLEFEAMAMLHVSGHGDLTRDEWIAALLDQQRDDGGWPFKAGGTGSYDHTTLLALWTLLEHRYPEVSAAIIPGRSREPIQRGGLAGDGAEGGDPGGL